MVQKLPGEQRNHRLEFSKINVTKEPEQKCIRPHGSPPRNCRSRNHIYELYLKSYPVSWHLSPLEGCSLLRLLEKSFEFAEGLYSQQGSSLLCFCQHCSMALLVLPLTCLPRVFRVSNHITS